MDLRVCCIYYFYDIRKIRKLGIGIMTFYKQYRKVPSLLFKKNWLWPCKVKQMPEAFFSCCPCMEGGLIGLYCFSKDQKKEGEVCPEYSD